MATVLVVDDEPSVRDLLHPLLRRKRAHVLLADCGIKALELSRRDTIENSSSRFACDHPYRMGDEDDASKRSGSTGLSEKGISLHELGKTFNMALEHLEITGQATISRFHNES